MGVKIVTINVSSVMHDKLKAIAITEHRNAKLQAEILLQKAIQDCKIDTSVAEITMLMEKKAKRKKEEAEKIELSEIDVTYLLLNKVLNLNMAFIDKMTPTQRKKLDKLVTQPKKAGQLLFEYLNGSKHLRQEMREILNYINKHKNI